MVATIVSIMVRKSFMQRGPGKGCATDGLNNSDLAKSCLRLGGSSPDHK